MKKSKIFSLIGVVLISSFAFGEETDNANAWKENLINQIEKEASYNGVGFLNPKSPVAVTQQINWLITWIQSYAFIQKRLCALKSLKVGLDVLKSVEEKQEKLAIEDFSALQSVQEKLSILESMKGSPEMLPLIAENLMGVNIAEDDFEVLKPLKNYLQVLIRAGRSPEEVKFFEESPEALSFIEKNRDQLGFSLQDIKSLKCVKNSLNVLKCSVKDLKALMSIKENFDILKSMGKDYGKSLRSMMENFEKLNVSEKDVKMFEQDSKGYIDMCRTFPPSFIQACMPNNFFLQFPCWPEIEVVEKLYNAAWEALKIQE